MLSSSNGHAGKVGQRVAGAGGRGVRSEKRDAVLLLARGTRARLAYWLLGALALAGFVAFWFAWPGPIDRRHPYLYLLATLSILYYVGVWAARWLALRHMRRPVHRPPEAGLRVGVATSFVPEFEPIEMLELSVRRLIALDYPHDTWVLDEGDDPAVRALCARLGAHHFTRRHRPEYLTPGGRFASKSKHGNYNAWLDRIGYDRYDIVVTFDPDHVAEPRFLTRTLGQFRDPAVGYVQVPQVYYNQQASFIARGAAEETYAYYSSHLMASYGLGHTIVVGSHSSHRVSALRDLGGFPAHDAEDLYLTMLYRAAGWQGVYVPEILALGTAPVDWAGYLRQQVRWSRAVLDLKRNVYPRLSRKLSPIERLLNLFHGIYYLRPLILMAFFVVLVGMTIQNATPAFLAPTPILALAGLSILLASIDRFRQRFFLDPERERGFHWRALLLQAAKVPHLTAALIDVVLNRKVSYITTPKARTKERPRRVLAAPHLALACVLAIALGAGYLIHGPLAPALLAGVLLFMGTSLTLAWTELWSFPPPFEPRLLADRRRVMGTLIHPEPVQLPKPMRQEASVGKA